MRNKYKITIIVNVTAKEAEFQTAIHHSLLNMFDNASFITGQPELLESIEVLNLKEDSGE